MPLSNVIPTRGQSATIILAFAAGVAVGANWPQIRKSLAPLMAVAGTKLNDVYSTVAQFSGEQKEAMEDAQTERRHRARRKPGTSGTEQEVLANLAAVLPNGKRRTVAKPTRKRAAGRRRKMRVATKQAASQSAPDPTRSRTAVG